MTEVIEFLASVLPVYRAGQDAGIWMINTNVIRDYLVAYVEGSGK